MYPDEDTVQAFELALMDDEALIRRTAVQSIYLSGQRRQPDLIAPLLYDPVAAVRMEAASTLAGEPSKRLSSDQRKVFQNDLQEYIESMEYSGDFAFGRYNLGNLYTALNEPQEAVRNYEAALKIDDLFYPAKVNLAMLYNSRGENDKAEKLFRDVVAKHPELYDVAYSLGLLLAEMGKTEEALRYLERAANGMPEHPRIQYNLGLLLQALKRDSQAEAALQKALSLDPANMDYLYAMADFYIKRNRLAEAKKVAERMVAAHPDQRKGREMLELIDRGQKNQ
jgi:Tfp pilus assembly protein PilF